MVNDQPSTDRPATAGWATASALVVIALALATLAAAAVWDTWLAVDPAPVAVELVGLVAVVRNLDVLRVVVDPPLVYQCLQTRAGEIGEEPSPNASRRRAWSWAARGVGRGREYALTRRPLLRGSSACGQGCFGDPSLRVAAGAWAVAACGRRAYSEWRSM